VTKLAFTQKPSIKRHTHKGEARKHWLHGLRKSSRLASRLELGATRLGSKWLMNLKRVEPGFELVGLASCDEMARKLCQINQTIK
jgi:hypothetical protein